VQITDRAKSGCIAVVEVEESPNPLAPSDAALAAIRVCRSRFEQPIAESLVVSFHVIVINAGSDRTPKVLFTERNDSTKTLLSKTPDPALRVTIQIGASRRQSNHFHAGIFEHLTKCSRVERIPIEDEIPSALQETIHAVRQVSSELLHPCLARLIGDSNHMHTPRGDVDNKEDVVPNQSKASEHLKGEKIGTGNCSKMRPNEAVPARMAPAFGCRLDSAFPSVSGVTTVWS
jgi:hypothetical protein